MWSLNCESGGRRKSNSLQSLRIRNKSIKAIFQNQKKSFCLKQKQR